MGYRSKREREITRGKERETNLEHSGIYSGPGQRSIPGVWRPNRERGTQGLLADDRGGGHF